MLNEQENFIEDVAKKIIDVLSEEDKKELLEHESFEFHFSLGLFIRNEYIYNKQLPFCCEPDNLSNNIIIKIQKLIKNSNIVQR